MCGGSGVRCTALQMRSSWDLVHLRWASGQREAVRAVPRYPPGNGSSCVRTCMRWPPNWMWASRARRASSLSRFLRVDWSSCR